MESSVLNISYMNKGDMSYQNILQLMQEMESLILAQDER
jgi:hypothetical protein